MLQEYLVSEGFLVDPAHEGNTPLQTAVSNVYELPGLTIAKRATGMLGCTFDACNRAEAGLSVFIRLPVIF